MERTPLIVGNWKMELSHKAEVEVARSIKAVFKNLPVHSDIVVCPSFPSLPAIATAFKNNEKISVGAQNIHWEEKGASTGSVSVLQISPFAEWCIVGHSEQRELTHENDAAVERKVDLLLKHGLTPVVCLGETDEKIVEQVSALLQSISRTGVTKLVIAYEPLWAIGSGKTPEPADIAAIILLMRKVVSERFDRDSAERIRLIYGGSVTPENITSIMAEPGIDGVLVGGVSVHPLSFLAIVKAVQQARLHA